MATVVFATNPTQRGYTKEVFQNVFDQRPILFIIPSTRASSLLTSYAAWVALFSIVIDSVKAGKVVAP
jgi:hypothetical protein